MMLCGSKVMMMEKPEKNDTATIKSTSLMSHEQYVYYKRKVNSFIFDLTLLRGQQKDINTCILFMFQKIVLIDQDFLN